MLNFLRRLRARFRYRRFNTELKDELDVHRAMVEDELRASGEAPEDAQRQAARQLGNATLARESSRGVWLAPWLENIWQDARYAGRGVRRRPSRLVAVVSLLGLAIGITTAMFTIVDALILRSVPFKDAEQLATIYMGSPMGGPSPPSELFRVWKTSPTFEAIEGARSASVLIEGDAGAATRSMARVTPGVFDLLGGVRPVHGRLFDAAEGRPGSDDRVLVSEDLWRSLYRADPALVGRSIIVGSQPVTVVGILPSDFRFPSSNTMVWRADTFEAPPNQRLDVYVRFSQEVPREDALRAATAAARALDANYATQEAHARSLANRLDDYYQRAAPLLSGGVILLFFVLCANASSLLLNDLAARGHEIATRVALGAPRARLVRHAFFESVLCGAGAIVAGVAIGWALVSAARAVLPLAALSGSLNHLNIDARSLIVTSMAGLVAILVAGVLPAIVGTRADAKRALGRAGRGSTDTARARLARRVLLAGQIALSCTLLLGATVLVRSFINLVGEDRGIDTSSVLVADMQFPEASFGTPEARTLAADRLMEQARSVPGIDFAAWSYGTPPGGAVTFSGDWTSDLPGAQPVEMTTNMFSVSPDFFPLYGIDVLRGRPFQASDGRREVLVSERFARVLWPGVDPIGRTFTFEHGPHVVIGVVKDIYYPSIDRTRDTPQWYTQFRGVLVRGMLSLRCSGRCPDMGLVTQRLVEAQPGVTSVSVRALDDFYASELARPRATAALAFVFAVVALVAAAAGLFSLMAHSAARRRREIGIRTALGASPADVRRLVWHDGLGVMLAGIGLGTAAGLATSRLLESLLYEVTMADAWNWVAVASVLVATMVAASWHPTRAASRMAPAVLLKEE